MQMTIEAIIAVVALVAGLPPAMYTLWKCWRRRREQRRRCEEEGILAPRRALHNPRHAVSPPLGSRTVVLMGLLVENGASTFAMGERLTA
ncbi:hypothetical protein BGZ61DRAFT_459067 [Ilyonectria robusta]|uniref:uncharacterized protein n=1 Tax=Ilyonectria robusta TaxID=1079257 RepID=UPI001E8D4D3D|nr:uncharacterized protein BGZ61DRAFT_459067 [Ilyonectria robusta]KAH8672227.1 hypothetical protein BGZ61DRAFT_459067 [Ilyonectria robusta]